MRWILLALAVGLAGCGDPGPRDRSLMRGSATWSPERNHDPLSRVKRKRRPGSPIIGLVSDDLAPLYADGAQLIVRFDDLEALRQEASPQLDGLAETLPLLGLPKGDPEDLLRVVLGLTKHVRFDAPRPFALVRIEEGWVAVLPTQDSIAGGGRLKSLDGIYCAAGDRDVIKAYSPGFRKGYYLPGAVSVIAKPEALGDVGTQLSRVLEPLGLDLGFLDGKLDRIADDLERVDLSLRFQRMGLRVDLRLAPSPESDASLQLDRLKPTTPKLVRWLPKGGSAYVELDAAPGELEALAVSLLGEQPRHLRRDLPPAQIALREALRALDQEAAGMVQLRPGEAGRVYFIARLSRPDAVRTFLRSEYFKDILDAIAGPGGHLEWRPEVFTRYGAQVGTVTGNISRSRLKEWRGGNVLLSTLSVLLRGPAVAYVTVLKNHLCVVVSQNSRADAERFLDLVRSDEAQHNEHLAAVSSLFRTRLAAASADLGSLFAGSLGAAQYWHPKGRELRELKLRKKLPVAVAVTAEGGALRISAQLPPRALADFAARIWETLK